MIELKEGGADIPVTEENKAEYVEWVFLTIYICIWLICHWYYSAVVEYRVHKRVEEQFNAFMAGFSELIPQDLINVFDEREIEVSWLELQFQSAKPEAFCSVAYWGHV